MLLFMHPGEFFVTRYIGNDVLASTLVMHGLIHHTNYDIWQHHVAAFLFKAIHITDVCRLTIVE